ncbi:MAG: UbiA family prenyltransferase [Actinobacteria bacterium]|nr:UbiA family prenyltransferase [Actinomycetota bacterium]
MLLTAVRDLVRPAFVFLVLTVGSIGIARADASGTVDEFAVIASVAAWAIAAAAVNDLADRRIDRVNLGHRPGRSLATGRLTPEIVVAVAATAAVTSLVCAALASWPTAAVMAVGMVLAALYSAPGLGMSGRGLATSVLLPLVYVAVPYAAGRLSAGWSVDAVDALLVGGLYVSFVGRLMLKDFRDEHGDRLFGKRTFLVRHGRATTCAVSGVLWWVGALLLVIPRDSFTIAAQWAMFGTIVVLQLRRISVDERGVDDVYWVAIVAICGRATLVSLLIDAVTEMRGTPWWAWWLAQGIVTASTLHAVHRWTNACATNPARDAARAPLPTTAPLPT